MRMSTLAIALVVLGATAIVSDAAAADSDHSAEGTEPEIAKEARLPVPIALIDVARIFKEDEKFKAEMARLKKAVGIAEVELKIRSGKIQKLIQRKQQRLIGDEDVSKEIMSEQSELNKDAAATKQQLMKEQDAPYLKTYRRMIAVTKPYAKQHGIVMILRNATGDDEEQPIEDISHEEVMRRINAPIVHHSSCDITDDIIKLMNPNEEE